MLAQVYSIDGTFNVLVNLQLWIKINKCFRSMLKMEKCYNFMYTNPSCWCLKIWAY